MKTPQTSVKDDTLRAGAPHDGSRIDAGEALSTNWKMDAFLLGSGAPVGAQSGPEGCPLAQTASPTNSTVPRYRADPRMHSTRQLRNNYFLITVIKLMFVLSLLAHVP